MGRPATKLSAEAIEAYVSGTSSTKIAEQLGCSPKTVRNALHRLGVAVRPSGPIARKPPKPPREHRTPEERFWTFVDRSGDGCWPWRGGTCKGYGTFSVKTLGRSFRAHRFAWELVHGPIPDGLHVLHRCDNPPCCNPAHLFLGTHLDNVADMIAKGRNAKGDRSGARLHPEKRLRGERNPHAKLTAEQVAEIRATPLRNGVQHALALRFGVSDAAISMIVNGKTWRPLTVSGAET